MYERRRLTFRDSNVRGALLLGALLTCILIVAAAISVRVYTQLDEAVNVQRALVDAQLNIDETLQIQLEQETSFRSYLATGDKTFLDVDAWRVDDFDTTLARLSADIEPLHIADLAPTIVEMKHFHAQWKNDIALPLIRAPHTKETVSQQTLGKVLVNELEGDAKIVHDVLERQLAYAQDNLKRGIQEALIGGLAVVVVFGAMGIVFLFSRTQMLAAIDRERGVVEALEGAFRSDTDGLASARIGLAYVSATMDAAVGGDLYDVRRLDDDRGLVIVADVSGKGLDAAVNTAFVKYSMRTLAFERSEPAAILDSFNHLFVRTVRDPSLFVVAIVAVLDGRRGELRYASAGHAGSFLRRGGNVSQLEVTGPIVGIDPDAVYEERTLALARGDLLVFATDGLTEARNARGDILEDTGAMALLRGAPADPQACADHLVAAVREMGGGTISDDLAILAVAFDGPTAALKPAPGATGTAAV